MLGEWSRTTLQGTRPPTDPRGGSGSGATSSSDSSSTLTDRSVPGVEMTPGPATLLSVVRAFLRTADRTVMSHSAEDVMGQTVQPTTRSLRVSHRGCERLEDHRKPSQVAPRTRLFRDDSSSPLQPRMTEIQQSRSTCDRCLDRDPASPCSTFECPPSWQAIHRGSG